MMMPNYNNSINLHSLKYKLRAECSYDLTLFINLCHNILSQFSMIKMNQIPDVEFEFTTDLSIIEVIDYLETLEDSHVMIETLKAIDSYTGIRDYSTTN